MSAIGDNLKRLRDRICEHALRCGRQPEEVRLMAVSKTFPASAVAEAVASGQSLFGENKVQEAMAKIPDCPSGLEWHLIGHLQSNKTKQAVQFFDVIETLDRPKLARRVGRFAAELGKTPGVLIQVNIGREPQKFGIPPEAVVEMAAVVDQQPALRLQGLMAIPPFTSDPEQVRPYFREMRQLLEQLNRPRSQPLTELSMGMSHDYLVAIEEGSTLLRLGTAIFGPRA